METKIAGHIVLIEERRIVDGCLVIENGKIKCINAQKVPTNAPYILPGFVDAHIHIESTLMTPRNYAAVAVTKGTIAAVCDPHEIVNVLGTEGLNYMIDNGNQTRFYFHFGVPSCVPSTPFETAGAALDAAATAQLLQRNDVYGLCEMMNAVGVVNKDEQVCAKLKAAQQVGKPIDGHSPGLSGEALRAYCNAGVTTDHECTSLQEAEERLALGMDIQIREGSAACDLNTLMPLFNKYATNLMLCSDDKYPDELREGYIDEMCSRAIRNGADLWSVLHAACIEPLIHYQLPHGRLRVGDDADFILVDNLKDFGICATYLQGNQVYAQAKVSDVLFTQAESAASFYPNHFVAKPIQVSDLFVPAQSQQIKVITAREGSLLTGCHIAEATIENGGAVSNTQKDILKLVCYGRHAEEKPQMAFISGFGLKQGAMASTIGHDSHNIIALGADDKSIATVINHLVSTQGGLAITDGKQLWDLALPIAGLMSPLSGVETAQRHQILKQQAQRLGCPMKAPFMTLAFMSLPVIPRLKLTDLGLFDGDKFEFTQLFV